MKMPPSLRGRFQAPIVRFAAQPLAASGSQSLQSQPRSLSRLWISGSKSSFKYARSLADIGSETLGRRGMSSQEKRETPANSNTRLRVASRWWSSSSVRRISV